MDTLRDNRLELIFDDQDLRRRIAGFEMVVHCHHYNSLLHRTIEACSAIDGKQILVSSAEAVFHKILSANLMVDATSAENWEFAARLYSRLGYGRINVSEIQRGIVTASASHFVEGYFAGSPAQSEPVCSLTAGYVQAAHTAITGEVVDCREVQCQITGAESCRFEIHRERTGPLYDYHKLEVPGGRSRRHFRYLAITHGG